MNEQKKGRPDRPLKRVVIREEFVSLVNAYCHEPSKKRVSTPYITAILLAQLLYWETKCRDYDAFRMEEYERLEQMKTFMQDHEQDASALQPPVLTHGWIYKTARDLSEETMLRISDTAIMTHLRRLLDIGVLEKRHNPHHHWDRCLQYRVNTIRLRQLLFTLGYNLEGWPILSKEYQLVDVDASAASSSTEVESAFKVYGNAFSKNGNRTPEKFKSNPRKVEIEPPKSLNRTPEKFEAIPETTLTEITPTEITAEITPTEIEENGRNETVTATSTALPTRPASSSPVTETTWDALAASPQGKDLITIYECSVHPIKEHAERNALMSLMKDHGSARVQVALWRAQTLGHRDLLSSMKDFLAAWKDLERRNQNNQSLSKVERNELRLLELRERACNGHYTEADAREAERLLYC